MFVSPPPFSLIRHEWSTCSTARSETVSLYQCDALHVPMWREFFVHSFGIYFFTNVTGNVFTIVMGEKYHYDGIIFPVPKCLFTNVQGCQCTNVPRPRKKHTFGWCTPQGTQAPRGHNETWQNSAPRAAGDEPLLAVRPLLDESKFDAAPACVSKEVRLQLRVEVVSHGHRGEDHLEFHTHAVLFLRRLLIWTVPIWGIKLDRGPVDWRGARSSWVDADPAGWGTFSISSEQINGIHQIKKTI